MVRGIFQFGFISSRIIKGVNHISRSNSWSFIARNTCRIHIYPGNLCGQQGPLGRLDYQLGYTQNLDQEILVSHFLVDQDYSMGRQTRGRCDAWAVSLDFCVDCFNVMLSPCRKLNLLLHILLPIWFNICM